MKSRNRRRGRPCDAPCEKCGAEDISRNFYPRGKEVIRIFASRKGQTTEFVDREYQYMAWIAKKDCIVHYCRVCQYEWDSAPLKPVKKGRK